MSPAATRVAYFSMEIAIEPSIPTYSGGLGVLAGDTLRSASDLRIPMVAVSLVHRNGYFDQVLDHQGRQTEIPEPWDPASRTLQMESFVTVNIEGRAVRLRAWRYLVCGDSGHVIPVFLLDSNCAENTAWDRHLTDDLYGGDTHYRLCQEAILGIGGLAMLRSLGYSAITTFHLNEGHAALLTLGLLEEQLSSQKRQSPTEADIRDIRDQCVFTTHTPVPAGHDKFTLDLVAHVLGPTRLGLLDVIQCCRDGLLNMTFLALRLSRYINGVAMHHGAISHGMFPDYTIRSITNGVHAVFWTSPEFRNLFDHHIPEWRTDNLYLRYAIGIPLSQIALSHESAKLRLFREVKTRAGVVLDPAVFTIGFARRAAAYKRFDLLFSNPDRLRSICASHGPIQVIFGGRAHPNDLEGKAQIQTVFANAAALDGSRLKLLYLEDYGLEWAKLLTSGVDLWLNTPQRPLEASGTSGMKAALNGVPSLSVLDGWWIEGCLEGITGWAIGRNDDVSQGSEDETDSLYDKLGAIVSLFLNNRTQYLTVMRAAIALNGSFFNTQRMLSQYVANAYAKMPAD